MKEWKRLIESVLVVIVILLEINGVQAALEISENTQECLECHAVVTPGIVGDWKRSRHAGVTPAEALKKSELERRISIKKAPEGLAGTVVGCAECHTRDPEKHKDSFDHNGHNVHIVVTPKDCAACHPTEVEQYDKNIMSQAYGNLNNNLVYHNLVNTVNGIQIYENMRTILTPPNAMTNADSCFFCHGTKVEVKGIKPRETSMGEMEFPVLSGWPNQGVGRINPDGSKGSCTACHARHQFSIEMARKPYTCSECHKGPDVPAYKIYSVSKHGNIFFSVGKKWDFSAVPWEVGKDFTAPTCAACHVSLLTTEGNGVIAERTHQMNNRLAWRLFGLVYAHPQPKSPDTTLIKNKAGLPLPTELTGEPAAKYLIDTNEQAIRRKTMQKICRSCHSFQWVEGHFARLENTIRTTNEMTLTATKILLRAWENGVAKGMDQGDSIFNEAIEKKWVQQWLFFANSTRYASAMMGADYGVFSNGRWYMSQNIQEMAEWLNFKLERNAKGKVKD